MDVETRVHVEYSHKLSDVFFITVACLVLRLNLMISQKWMFVFLKIKSVHCI